MAFKECFKNRMEDLGLPAPQTIFGSLAAATATIAALAKAVATYGTRVTVAEIVGATFVGEGAAAMAAGLGEVVGVAGALTASFYLGACIGSLLACTIDKVFFSRSTGTVSTQYAALYLSRRKIVLSSEMYSLMHCNPEMLGAKPSSAYDARLELYGYRAVGGESSSESGYA